VLNAPGIVETETSLSCVGRWHCGDPGFAVHPIIQSINEQQKYNMLAGSATENVTKLSFASSKCIQLSSHNFVDFCLQMTPSISKLLLCRSPFRSLPPSPIRRMSKQRRCRTFAIHCRWCRSLWAPTTLNDDGPLNLVVTTLCLEQTSCLFPVTFLVLSLADHSTSQVFQLHLSCGFYHKVLLKACFKSLSIRP